MKLISNVKFQVEDFFKFCGLLRISELYFSKSAEKVLTKYSSKNYFKTLKHYSGRLFKTFEGIGIDLHFIKPIIFMLWSLSLCFIFYPPGSGSGAAGTRGCSGKTIGALKKTYSNNLTKVTFVLITLKMALKVQTLQQWKVIWNVFALTS